MVSILFLIFPSSVALMQPRIVRTCLVTLLWLGVASAVILESALDVRSSYDFIIVGGEFHDENIRIYLTNSPVSQVVLLEMFLRIASRKILLSMFLSLKQAPGKFR